MVIGFVFMFVVVWVRDLLKFIKVVVMVMMINGMFNVVCVRIIFVCVLMMLIFE